MILELVHQVPAQISHGGIDRISFDHDGIVLFPTHDLAILLQKGRIGDALGGARTEIDSCEGAYRIVQFVGMTIKLCGVSMAVRAVYRCS